MAGVAFIFRDILQHFHEFFILLDIPAGGGEDAFQAFDLNAARSAVPNGLALAANLQGSVEAA